jgi:hypothetical protein
MIRGIVAAIALYCVVPNAIAQNNTQSSSGNCSPNIAHSDRTTLHCNAAPIPLGQTFQASLYMQSGNTNVALGGPRQTIDLHDIQYHLTPLTNGGGGAGDVLGKVIGNMLALQLIITVPGSCPVPVPFLCNNRATVFQNFAVQVPLPKSGSTEAQVDLVSHDGRTHLPAKLIMNVD